MTQKLRPVQLEVVLSAQQMDLNASNHVNIIFDKNIISLILLLNVSYSWNQKIENIRMKNIYVMNKLKANVSIIWKSYSN